MPETIFGLILVGGAMFGLGFLASLWITFGAVWVKTEPTYWTTTVGTTATSRTMPSSWPLLEPRDLRPMFDYGNRPTPPPPPERD